MARTINFFDGAESSTTPTIGNIVASDLIQYPNDAAFEAGEAGAPAEGNIYFNTTIKLIRYYNGTAWISIVDESSTQTIQNKTIDGTDASGNNVVTNDATDVSYDNSSSSMSATDAQGAIDEVEARVDTNESDIADLETLSGVAGATDNGTFSGSTIPDNQDTKEALQALETEVESRIASSEKGANNGVATLDGSGKLPTSQLSTSAMEHQGSWNATTNSPTLIDGTGDNGDLYVVSVAGTQDLGSGSETYGVGDVALYNGTIWEKIPAASMGGGGAKLLGGGEVSYDAGAGHTNLNSYDFTGGGEAIVPSNALFNQTNNVSVFCWMNTSTTGVDQTLMSQWDAISSSNQIWSLGFNDTSGSGNIEVRVSDGTGKKVYLGIGAAVNDGSWHLIGYTFTTNTLKIYVDGVELTGGSLNKVTDNNVNTLNSFASKVFLSGQQNFGFAENLFTGLSDELTYWNKELTGAEVTELYGAGGVIDITAHSAAANNIAAWIADGDSMPTFTDIINSLDGNDATGNAATSTTVNPGASGSADLTFDNDFFLEVAGLNYSDNTIPSSESPIALVSDEDVAYVIPNTAPAGPDLTIVIDTLDNVPPTGVIIARQLDSEVIIGDTLKLKDGESSQLYEIQPAAKIPYVPTTPGDWPVVPDTTGIALDELATGAGSANDTLSNLGTVAVNANIDPDFDNARNLGNGAARWAEISAASAVLNALKFVDGFEGSSGDVLTSVDGFGTVVWQTPAAAGATPALDNLASVQINTDLIPDTNKTLDLGSAGFQWDNVFVECAEVEDQVRINNNALRLDGTGGISTPSGKTAEAAIFSNTGGATRNIGTWTANGSATGDLDFETGNASSTDSGDINIRIGTASGTRGSINMIGAVDHNQNISNQVVWASGVTGSRPGSPVTGERFFDTTLGHPIWYDGTNWVDATGATV